MRSPSVRAGQRWWRHARAAQPPTGPSEEVKKLHQDFVNEIHKRELSSSENFDKSVLTFSSAGLAISIGFLKDFVPIQVASMPYALYGSWILFTAASCSTMASFLVSGKALAAQKVRAYRYYMEGDDAAYDHPNNWDRATVWLNYASGGAFLIAMALTVLFISVNLEKGSNMTRWNSQKTLDGAPVPTMQAVVPGLVQKGNTIPTLQKIPTQPAQQPASSLAPATATPPSTPHGR